MWRRFSRLRDLARARWDALLATPDGAGRVARGAAAGAFAAMIPAFGLHVGIALAAALLARQPRRRGGDLPPGRQPAHPRHRPARRLRAGPPAHPAGRGAGNGLADVVGAWLATGRGGGARRRRPARRGGGGRCLPRGATCPEETAKRPAVTEAEPPAPSRRMSNANRLPGNVTSSLDGSTAPPVALGARVLTPAAGRTPPAARPEMPSRGRGGARCRLRRAGSRGPGRDRLPRAEARG